MVRIRDRAIRRCGELLKQVDPGKGGRPSTNSGVERPSFEWANYREVSKRGGGSFAFCHLPSTTFSNLVDCFVKCSFGLLLGFTKCICFHLAPCPEVFAALWAGHPRIIVLDIAPDAWACARLSHGSIMIEGRKSSTSAQPSSIAKI